MEMRRAIEDRASSVYLAGLLKGMAWAFNHDAELSRSFYRRENGGRVPFDGRYQFNTREGSVPVYLAIEGGKMRGGIGTINDPHLTAILKDTATLRHFFSPVRPADPLGLLLGNELAFTGNLVYLARLGHMTATFRDRAWRAKPGVNGEAGTAADRGGTMLGSSRVGRKVAFITCARTPECQVLEDPYLSRYSLPDFPRLAEMRAEFFGARGEICTERPRLVTEYCRTHGFEAAPDGTPRDPYLRQAGTLAHVMANKEPIIRDRAFLAGTTTARFPGVVIYPELSGTTIWAELSNANRRRLNPYRISSADADLLNEDVFPYWTDRNVREWVRTKFDAPRCQALDERWVLYFMWKVAAVSHTIPDYPQVLRRGLAAMRDDATAREATAQDGKARSFCRAVQVVLDGVIAYAERLAGRAEEMARGTSDPARRAELLELARICRKVPAGPAESLHEAIQSVWICAIALHMENMNAGFSIGRLDVWLQPYFLMDAAKAATPESRVALERRAIELVGSFFLQCNDHLPLVPDVANRLFGGSSSDMALTVGGVDAQGRSAVCDMTYVVLKAAEMLTLRDPNLNARFHPGVNSIEYLRRLCEVNAITGATPSIHNDEAVLKSLVKHGFPIEDARDWGATGCVEPTMCGRHYGHTNCMMLNTVAALEMALNDGVHPLIGEQIGPRTGTIDRFATFGDFLGAYQQQLGFLIDQSVEYNNLLGRAHQHLHPTPLVSSLIDGCLEKGRDAIDGGARYNSSGAALVSVADVVDSLLAVKQIVYDEKSMTFADLKAALDRDFAGDEALLARLVHKIPKFGSGVPGTGELAQEVIDFIHARYLSHENYRGGRYTSGFWSMSNHVAFGSLSGALPSGRRKGKAFTPGITPEATASDSLLDNLRAVAALDPAKMPNNIAFNVKLSPAPGEPHEKFVDHATAYTKTYFELGGMQLQFNMVSTAMLRDAMEHPESYRNLMVRISGYNAYFVELNREMQIELIERAEYS